MEIPERSQGWGATAGRLLSAVLVDRQGQRNSTFTAWGACYNGRGEEGDRGETLAASFFMLTSGCVYSNFLTVRFDDSGLSWEGVNGRSGFGENSSGENSDEPRRERCGFLRLLGW